MLLAINDRIKGWLGIAVVILIALPFAFWGIQEYTTGGGSQVAAKIDDIEISDRELDFNFAQYRQRMLDQYNGKLPFSESMLKQQVLEQLVNRKIVESSTYETGYRISDANLSGSIKEMFTREGKFDRELFERMLQARGRTVPQFEYEMRTEMRVLQLRDSLVNSSFVTDEEARRLAQLEDESREISVITYRLDDYTADVTVTEDDIKNTYDLQAQRYMLPEKVSVDYVELTHDQLSADIKTDEEKIQLMYDDYVANVSQREQRRAGHILLKAGDAIEESRKKLEDIKQQVANGASFEDLAREHSIDPGSAKQGGDLGWVEPGQMVKPFEDALFAMKEKNSVSDIVESQFGLHLIKLVDIKGEEVKSLEDKRAEFESELKKTAVSNMFYDMSENLATTAYESPDSLDAVVEATGLQVKTSSLFTREAGAGVAEHAGVRKAAFSNAVLKDGANSDIVEISPEHVVVLRLREHQKPTLRPLEEVRAAIENGLKLKAAHEKALAAATEAKTKIEAGEAVESVLLEGQEVEKPGSFTRKDASKVDQSVLVAAFNMPPTVEGKVSAIEVSTFTGDVKLVMLDKVSMPENVDQARIDLVKRQWRADVANREFDAVLANLRSSADLYINPRVKQSESLQ